MEKLFVPLVYLWGWRGLGPVTSDIGMTLFNIFKQLKPNNMLSNAKSRTAGKTKTTIITALLLLAMVSGAVAQEKWEYAIVEHDHRNVHVIKRVLELFPVSKDAVPSAEVIKKVEEMCKDGWEVFNTAVRHDTNLNRPVHSFYLRKKLKD